MWKYEETCNFGFLNWPKICYPVRYWISVIINQTDNWCSWLAHCTVVNKYRVQFFLDRQWTYLINSFTIYQEYYHATSSMILLVVRREICRNLGPYYTYKLNNTCSSFLWECHSLGCPIIEHLPCSIRPGKKLRHRKLVQPNHGSVPWCSG